jgi:hypothetical protein
MEDMIRVEKLAGTYDLGIIEIRGQSSSSVTESQPAEVIYCDPERLEMKLMMHDIVVDRGITWEDSKEVTSELFLHFICWLTDYRH